MNRTIIKIFLASPGDLIEERRAAKRIVEEENTNHANERGYQIELVGWEDTVAQHGRAQEIINRDLDQCNYFVGLLWKRWGTPPGPQESTYTSGFEEEYDRSHKRYQKTGKPNISLLFKDVSEEDKRDIGPQLAEVLAFKKQFTNSYGGAYQTFSGLRDFEQRFRSIVAMFLRTQMKEDATDHAEEKSKVIKSNDNNDNNDLEVKNVDSAIFDVNSRIFINDLINRKQQETEFEYTPTEAARFRLLANSLGLSQNDDETLGVHDANLIYQNLKEQNLSDREKRHLLQAGLSHFNSQNAPLWYWLYNQAKPIQELFFLTLMKSDERKRNAFRILSLISENVDEACSINNREKTVKLWLSSENNDVLASALDYLGDCGSSIDIGQIDEHINSSETTISKAATSAKIKILAKENISQALEFVSSREDIVVSKELTELLLENTSTIETTLLEKCISNRSVEFRKKIASELYERKSLNIEQSKALAESEHVELRVLAAKALRTLLDEFSLSDARNIIVKPKKPGLLFSDRDFEGEQHLDRYNHLILTDKSYKDLLFLRDNENIYKNSALFAAYDKYYKLLNVEIAENLDDNYDNYFKGKISKINDNAAIPDDKLEKFIKKEMVQKTVEIISRKLDNKIIGKIRNKIDEFNLEFSLSIIKYLEKFGAWDDVARIIKLCSNFPFRSFNMFADYDRSTDYSYSAKAILKLSRGRLGDLFALDIPANLLKFIYKEMSNTVIAKFDDHKIITMLNNQDESVRKILSLKLITSVTKARLKKIVDTYINSNQAYYYNVVFWLDLGLSSSEARRKNIAQKAMI